jgi:hypothetical protein
MSCFESSRKLLLMVEQTVVEYRVDIPEGVRTVMHRFLLGPVGFLAVGFRAISAPLVLWAVVTIVIWLVLWGLGHSQPGAKDASFSVAAFVAGGFVTFMLPSGCATSGIKPAKVMSAKAAVVALASDGAAVRRLKDAVGVMKARCEGRIKRLSWALGIAWAALLWAFVNTVLKTDLAAAERNHNANDLFGYGLIFMLAAIGFACYEAAVRVLFQTMDFAFIEAGAEFSSTEHSTG